MSVKFNIYASESKARKASTDKAFTQLGEMGLISEPEGAKREVETCKHVICKKDGTSIYVTRDIRAAIKRYEQYEFDKTIFVLSSQQDLHAQFFKVLELMGFPWAKSLVHVDYGLNLIIKEAGNFMHEQMQKNEEMCTAVENPKMTGIGIGITGVEIQDMAAKRINDYTFNWDRMKSFEGDTGPYLQYAHVRPTSIDTITTPSPSAHCSLNTHRCTGAICARARNCLTPKDLSQCRKDCAENTRTQRGGNIRF